MKKLFLFLLIFSSIGFSQLVKPSAGGASRDSLRYVVPKTLNNNYTSNSFFAKTIETLYNAQDTTTPILYSDYNYQNYGLGGHNFETVTTSAQRNQAFGISALDFLTTGSNNIAIGNNTMGTSQTDYNMVAIGNGACKHNVVGTYYGNGVYIGYSAGASGGGIGSQAIGLFAQASGTSNSSQSIGNYSLYQGQADSTIAIGLQSGQYCGQYLGIANSIFLGAFAGDSSNFVNGGKAKYNIYIGYRSGANQLNESNFLRIGNNFGYPKNKDFITGDMANAKINFNVITLAIDSTGGTLAYHTIIGNTNRTAGIDSLTSGIDTIRTTAYDANSLVFITNLSIGTGLTYINKANSLAGSYFVVTSTVSTDSNKFNWFILKTY